jgi:hypothetical protein
MIKDLGKSLAGRAMSQWVAVSAAFSPPCGVAFVYDPIVPAMMDMYGMP